MTQIVIPNTNSVASLNFDEIVAIDISSFTGTEDYISLSLPEFPSPSIDLTQTFIDFTSNPEGDFGIGPVDQIAFSEATPALPGSVEDTEMRVPISLLLNIDKSSITGVRFRIFAKESCEFRCLSIRACSSEWQYAPIDLDTLWNRVHNPPSPNGAKSIRINLSTNPSNEVTKTFSESGIYKTSRVNASTESIAAVSGSFVTKSVYEGGEDSNVGFIPFTFPSEGTYTVSAFVYLPSNWDGGSIQWNAEGYTGSTEVDVETVSSGIKGVWQRAISKITVKSGDLAGNLVLRAAPGSPTISHFLFIDAVLIESGSTINEYFDGSFPNAKWSGSANSTTSLLLSDFPTAESKAWPILFRSNSFTGLSDPMPVNINIGTAITSGSFEQATGLNKNEFAFYLRDVPTDNQTQVELNSMNQAQLETYQGQPDFGRALYDARDQQEIDLYDQTELDTKSQFNIERKPDESEHTWIEIKVKWGQEASSNSLTILDADEVGYSFKGFEIEASNSHDLDKGIFWLLVELQDTTIRARIFPINQIGEITSEIPIFDSGLIYDDNMLKRRKGRCGWWAHLQDGDSHINNIKTRGVNYGELISKEFLSITPVKGVSLYAGSTADHELISGFEPTDRENVKLSFDPAASATSNATKIEVSPLKPLQGIITNPFLIDDPKNIRISFDIKFPSLDMSGGSLSAFLLGEFEDLHPVHLSHFTKDIWTHIKVSLREGLFQTGSYRLLLMQVLPVSSATWWIENLSVRTYSIKWSARPHKSDAWNVEGDRWQDLGFTLNSLNGGLIFDELGSGLQIRAQALRQDAMIAEFKAIPQYATLGRFIFRDEVIKQIKPETKLKITSSVNEHTVSLIASQESSVQIVGYYWNFGDGTEDAGIYVSHTYDGPGSYAVTLIALDSEGQSTSIQATVVIS